MLLVLYLLGLATAYATQNLASPSCNACCSFNIQILKDSGDLLAEYECTGPYAQKKQHTGPLEDMPEEEILPGVKLFARTDDGVVMIHVSGGKYFNLVDSTVQGLTDGIASPILVEDGSFLHMERGQILQNKGKLAGGVMALGGSVLVLDETHFEGNSGGAVVASGINTLASLHSVTFLMNTGHQVAVDLLLEDGAVVNSTSSSFSGVDRGSTSSLPKEPQWDSSQLVTDEQELWSSINVGDGCHLIMNENTVEWFISAHGAIHCEKDSIATLVRSKFADNFGLKGSSILSEGGNVVLDGCEFTRNFGEFGGSVASLAGGHLYVANSLFEDNVAAFGGAVYTGQLITDECSEESVEGSFNIRNSLFARNTAQMDGGCIYSVCESLTLIDSKLDTCKAGLLGGGLVSRLNAETTILNTNITKCTGENGGGLSVIDVHMVNLSALEVFGNEAQQNGGAAHALRCGQFVAANMEVFNNKALASGGGFSLEAVEYTNLTQCRVVSNSAESLGGGIHLQDASRLEATNIVVSDNNATTGGGIWMNESLSTQVDAIVKDRFLANSPHQINGAAHEIPSIRMIDSLFMGNNAEERGGGAYMKSLPAFTCQSCEFTSNSALLSGGGFVASGCSSLLLFKSKFEANTALTDGGAFEASTVDTTVVDSCSFEFNQATTGSGGALSITSSVDTAIFEARDCTFADNQALVHGGAVSQIGTYGYFGLQNSSFLSNTAGSLGGCVFANSIDSGVVSSCTFTNASASSGGGSIYIGAAKSLDMRDGAIVQSQSISGSGGAIFLHNVVVTDIQNFNFSSCSCDEGNGGALYISPTESYPTSRLALSNSAFYNNRASGGGGGGFIDKVANISINDTTYDRNMCDTKDGGALAIEDAETIDLAGCILQANSAGANGGGLAIVHAMNTTISGLFSENQAVHRSGGAVFGDHIDCLDIAGAHFRLNQAQLTGGAISVIHTNNVSLFDSIFNQNSAWAISGGAVGFESVAELGIKACQFTENTAASGGAMWVHEIPPQQMGVSIAHTVYTQNHATDAGGALMIQGGIASQTTTDHEQEKDLSPPVVMVLNNATLDGNFAETGGALMVEEGLVYLEISKLLNNHAEKEGGAFNCGDGAMMSLSDTRIAGNRASTGSGLSASCGCQVSMYQCMVEDNSALSYKGESVAACDDNVIIADTDISGNSSAGRPWWHYLAAVAIIIALVALFIMTCICCCVLIKKIKKKRQRVYSGYAALGPVDPEAPDLMQLVQERMQNQKSEDSTDSSASEGIPAKDLPDTDSEEINHDLNTSSELPPPEDSSQPVEPVEADAQDS